MKGDEFLKLPKIFVEWWIFKTIHHPTTIWVIFKKKKKKKKWIWTFMIKNHRPICYWNITFCFIIEEIAGILREPAGCTDEDPTYCSTFGNQYCTNVRLFSTTSNFDDFKGKCSAFCGLC